MTENEAINVLNMIEAHGALAVEAKEMAINALEEVQKYRAIGTPEECRVAMEERQNPRAAITEKEDTGTTRYICPTCGMYMGWSTGTFPARYCWKCGQKLDWSDGE